MRTPLQKKTSMQHLPLQSAVKQKVSASHDLPAAVTATSARADAVDAFHAVQPVQHARHFAAWPVHLSALQLTLPAPVQAKPGLLPM